MTYKKIQNSAGRTMYYRDNKLVKTAEVPIYILESKIFGEPIEVAEMPDTTRPERNCIFCGQDGKYSKFIHGQVVYLCEEDYINKTTGQVGGKVKENYG